MGLAIQADHLDLAGVVRSFLARRKVAELARRMTNGEADGAAELDQEIAAQGWQGLHLPESLGGAGYGLTELAVVTEALGGALTPGAFLPSVLAGAVLSEATAAGWGGELPGRLVPGLVDGTVQSVVALCSEVVRSGDTVTGSASAALGSPSASVVLLLDGVDVLVLDAGQGVLVEAAISADLTRPLVSVYAQDSPFVVLPGAAAVLLRFARTLFAAEASGIAGSCLEQAAAYAKVREQFGRPIASFQAVKHLCANMLLDAELATATAWGAARAVDDDEGRLLAAAAAVQALPAALRCAQRNIQIHGGIGYSWEHDAHMLLRRAATLAALTSPDQAADELVRASRAGVVVRPRLDLPAEAEIYRRQAAGFRAELVEAESGDHAAMWARSGMLVPHWPAPYGRGADAVEQLVLEEELDGLPRAELGIGEWVLLTLLQKGTAKQAERWLWPGLEGQLEWCQMFSEPAAGSDAAAVTTKAVRVDGGWLVTGQKVWTSQAHHCQRGLATVRTDPAASKHGGITAVVIELDAPGVDVRELRDITDRLVFNEVWLEDVFVPDDDVVGEVGGGWAVARATLGNERVSIGGTPHGMTATQLLPLLERHAPADAAAARAVGHLVAEGLALSLLGLRAAARAVAGSAGGPEGNVSKLLGSEHAQRCADQALALAGPAAVAGGEPEALYELLYTRCLTIAGGTSEILRNVISERILGLPREPSLH